MVSTLDNASVLRTASPGFMIVGDSLNRLATFFLPLKVRRRVRILRMASQA